jgi:hypothetical protein
VDYELKLNAIKQMKAFTRWNKIRKSYGCFRIKVVHHGWNEMITAFLVLTQLTRGGKNQYRSICQEAEKTNIVPNSTKCH